MYVWMHVQGVRERENWPSKSREVPGYFCLLLSQQWMSSISLLSEGFLCRQVCKAPVNHTNKEGEVFKKIFLLIIWRLDVMLHIFQIHIWRISFVTRSLNFVLGIQNEISTEKCISRICISIVNRTGNLVVAVSIVYTTMQACLMNLSTLIVS